MAKRYTKKQIRKKVDGQCYFCGESQYELLDAHRIFPGSDGGTYDSRNTMTLCALCHRRVHNGDIRIDKKYFSTTGWQLHYFIGDREFWREVNG